MRLDISLADSRSASNLPKSPPTAIPLSRLFAARRARRLSPICRERLLTRAIGRRGTQPYSSDVRFRHKAKIFRNKSTSDGAG